MTQRTRDHSREVAIRFLQFRGLSLAEKLNVDGAAINEMIYRPFVTLTSVPSITAGTDSANASREVLGFCDTVSKALGFRAWANRDRDAGDSVAVWWNWPSKNAQWRKP